MSGMKFCLSGMMVALLAASYSQGQESSERPTGSPPPLAKDPSTINTNPPGPGAPGAPPDTEVLQMGPSSWLLYPRSPGCCGPTGADGTIGGEIYFRSGVSIPVGGNFFGRLLEPGWQIEGGGRTIFYKKSLDSAWIIDLGITTIFNDTNSLSVPVTLQNVKTANANVVVPLVPIAVKHMNRTYVNAAGGKEWYIWGTADKEAHCASCALGVDVGGRYGTEKVDINKLQVDSSNLRHLTDVIGGTFCACHTDMMIPFGPGFFVAGFRAEWGYTWSNILQKQNNSDIQDINFLGTVGFQF